MKLFLSWSEDRSKRVAEFFKTWISLVLQYSSPWISTHDIDSGAVWVSELNSKLSDCSVGIIFLTRKNKNNPWILFEAGALAKGLETNKVCTFLVDLEVSEIQGPLEQFNHTMPNKESIKKLVQTLNNLAGTTGLQSDVFNEVFETYWTKFQEGFKKILAETKSVPPPKKPDESEMMMSFAEKLDRLIRQVNRMEVRQTHRAVPEMTPNNSGLAALASNMTKGNSKASVGSLEKKYHNEVGAPINFNNERERIAVEEFANAMKDLQLPSLMNFGFQGEDD